MISAYRIKYKGLKAWRESIPTYSYRNRPNYWCRPMYLGVDVQNFSYKQCNFTPAYYWDSKWSPNNSSLPPHWPLLLRSWVYYFLTHGESPFLPIPTKYLKSCLFCLYLLETSFISIQWNCIALFIGKVLDIHS